MAEKVIAGTVAKGYTASVSERDTIEEMQSTRCYKGNLYLNRLDGLWYYCIKDVGTNAAQPTPEFFDMTPVSLKDFATFKRLCMLSGGLDATGLDLRNDDNAIWGGEYGGYIQDTSITKVVGKRYIDQFDKKAYECLVPSHENTIANYRACNVKDNLSKLNNLFSDVWYYNSLVQEIDLNVLEGELFFVYLYGQVKATGVTHNYVGSSAFIVRKNDLERKFNLQVQGSGPGYRVGVIFRNNKLVADLSGDTLYGIAGQIVRIF